EETGVDIIRRALEAPLNQIASNAGLKGDVIVVKVKNSKSPMGFDLRSDGEELTDMFEAGVIDPTMVARTALQNAASIASLLITTEAVVVDKPETEGKGSAMPGGMPGGMGMPGGGMGY
ncbi:unnamed protein product, partial [marine sediment metagenome]